MPDNMLNQRYYSSLDPVHCVYFYDAHTACEGKLILNLNFDFKISEQNFEKVKTLTRDNFNARHRSKFLPGKRLIFCSKSLLLLIF